MNQSITPLTQYLWLPLVVALLSGFLIYWIQFTKQKKAIRRALLCEINSLLDNLSDYRDYLSKSDHSWTTVGKTISESPILARSDYKVFLAVLPNIHYLSSIEIS